MTGGAGSEGHLAAVDVLFGTYRYRPEEPREMGLDRPFPRSHLGRLIHPFVRSRVPPVGGG